MSTYIKRLVQTQHSSSMFQATCWDGIQETDEKEMSLGAYCKREERAHSLIISGPGKRGESKGKRCQNAPATKWKAKALEGRGRRCAAPETGKDDG